MTIGPKKKISKYRTNLRHKTWRTLNIKRLDKAYKATKCSNCGAVKIAYHVCPVCGYYNGKQVLTIKSKDKSTVVDA